ncbi:hypothetical protein [Bradyrhizobium sp. SSUT77]|uniref:hypothetical protein n=1 Tax=Bradyrhizobium sp. SSUT77 TaxID=3040603 RepID=UPI002449893E|nr:hypothetical protein [Bradyrhizobium sp. SSUT77]MDH2347069.1 hypothetical protein [Bradyrhizobium sp. SSUT77]
MTITETVVHLHRKKRPGSRYRADQHLAAGGNMYALFEGERQIGNPFATEKEAWEAALIEGLVTDVPVADEEGGQLLPAGYHVRQLDEGAHPHAVKGCC